MPDLALASLDALTAALDKITTQLDCPKLMKFDMAQLDQYPGYQKSTQAGITR